MKASVMRNTGCNRRVAPPISLPATLEDPGVSWKGPPPGDPNVPFNSAPSFGSGPPPPGGYQGPFQGPPAGSPASSGPYAPGSSTPQYTASPAPSGSSTPGPGPPQFPPPPANSNYNGPGPFGSPSSSGPNFVGRPGSSGPFGPPGGNPHFGGPGAQFAGHQFGMPPGSPFGHGPLPGPIPGHGMMPGQMPPGPVDRMDQGCVPVPRRHTPYFGQPDFRIYELNKRLQQRTDESDNLWWDAFATEFFEDDATLTLTFCLEDGPKRYTIGRTLIPRYFRSIFEGGVTELYYNLKHPKESFHNTSITLDCDQCTMVTHHGKPIFTKWSGDRGSVEAESYCQVCTEGRLILEFTFDDLMRIKSWHLAVRSHRELVPRSVLSLHSQGQDPAIIEQLSKNITRQGITNSTLNYLRLCVILEPMQELMSRHKAYALSPRDCLKTTLFQKWQRMVAPPDELPVKYLNINNNFLLSHPMYRTKSESQRPANKRRKRKGSQSGGAANNAPPAPNKKRSPGPNFSLASQDVMVVGEPSLMGGEFGDEDERLITRLENTQYDGANSLDHDPHPFGDSPLAQANSWGGPGAPEPRSAPANTPSSQDSGDKKSPAAFFDQSNSTANALNNGVCKNV